MLSKKTLAAVVWLDCRPVYKVHKTLNYCPPKLNEMRSAKFKDEVVVRRKKTMGTVIQCLYCYSVKLNKLSCHTVAGNVLQIGDGRAFQHKS
jgi:hypothetical protein